MSEYTRSGTRRAGDDYQDAVALDILVDALEHADRYAWIEVEADGVGVLDDVCAVLKDGRLILKQVKFSTDPLSEDAELDWQELLRQREGERRTLPSLLQRWADSLRRATALGPIADAALETNRLGSGALLAATDHSGRVELEKIAVSERGVIVEQLGGESEAREFFGEFKFRLNRPSLESLEESIRRRFGRLSGKELGWLNLKERLRQWVKFKNEPAPDGRITLAHIKRAAQWYTLRSLPQNFGIPNDYVAPDAFHKDTIAAVGDKSAKSLVVFGSPGVGKSTYLSYLCGELDADEHFLIIRHHYSLSMTDPHERFDHNRVAESLMVQLERACPDSLGPLGGANPKPDQLRDWITASAGFLAAKQQRLIVVVDGLDHVWREAGATSELTELFNHLLPVPTGSVLIVGTQKIAPEHLPKRLINSVPPELWRELPPLDSTAVRKWVDFHGGDFELPDDHRAREVALDVLAGAFHEKTDGHPLHLRFTLRALQERE